MRKNWKKLVSLVLTAACTMVVTVAPVFADAAVYTGLFTG